MIKGNQKPCHTCGQYSADYILSGAWTDELEMLISKHQSDDRLAACETHLDAWHLYQALLKR